MRLSKFLPLILFTLFNSCALLYPPSYNNVINSSSSASDNNNSSVYISSISSTSSMNSSSVSSVSSSGGSAGLTLYITGQDHNTYACLWIVNTASGSVSTNVLTASANGSALGSYIFGNVLYIAGSDGTGAATHNALYWTIPTNGGTVGQHVLQNGTYIGAVDVSVSAGGTVWAVGCGTSGSCVACYWTNGVQVNMNSGNAWESTGGLVVFNDTIYSSFHSGAITGTDSGYLYIGGASPFINMLSNSTVPHTTGYTGGIVVTNGVIYISQEDSANTLGYVWISSNNGVSFNAIVLNGNLPMGQCGDMYYDSGILYVGGTIDSGYTAPCYWKINTSTGSVNQVTLTNANGSNCAVYDLAVRSGVVYAVGRDGLNACYWIGPTEYILDANAAALSGITINP